jgi:Zinc carboxypeptidase
MRHSLVLASVVFLAGCYGSASWRRTGVDGGWGAETNSRVEIGGDSGNVADASAAVPDIAEIGADAQPDSNPLGTTDSSMPDRPGFEAFRAPDAASTIDGVSPDEATDRGAGADLAEDFRAAADRAVDAGAGADLATADSTIGAPDADGEGPEVGESADSGCTPGGSISVDKLPPIDFLAYHDQPWIETYLQAVAAALPAIAEYKVLGQSGQGRDLPYLVINATCQASPLAVFANGTHHGDEPSSTESVLAIPDYLLRKSTTDATMRGLLAAYAFYVLPLVNPDGFAANTRENADGADINRDYSYPDRSDADSFKTVEARLMKSLQESVGFHAAIAFHSGAQEVIWPWCYTGDATADAGFFTAAGQRAAQAMNFAIYQQSYDDYPTEGEYIDFAYWRSHSLAATFEVSTVKAPSAASLAGVVDGACKGTVAWIQAVNDHDKGSLHALPAAPTVRKRFPFTAPFDGTNRLE